MSNKTKEKTVVKNVYAFLKQLKQDLKQELKKSGSKLYSHEIFNKYDNVEKVAVNICGISKSTLYLMLKGEPENHTIVPLGRPEVICSENIQFFIKTTVLDFYVNKKYPNIDTILKKCRETPEFPAISRNLLYKWLLEKCNFKFKRINKKPVFLEKKGIAVSREIYLKKIQKYRDEDYYIIYTDETWSNHDQSPNKCWKLLAKPREIPQFLEQTREKVYTDMKGEIGGFKVKGGAGRIIVNHAGGRNGFLPGVEDVFISKTDSRDYHTSMNIEHWTNWFKKLLELAPNHSVIVVDQAPYHRERVPETIMASKSWKKSQIIENLILRKVPLPDYISGFEKLTVPTLIALSQLRPVQTKYIIEVLAEKCGKDIKVLWLPVAHCEFNPIELVWSNVKGYIAKNNQEGGPNYVLQLTKQALAEITPQLWSSCCDRAIEFENSMRERDRIIDQYFDESLAQNDENRDFEEMDFDDFFD